MTVDNTMIVYPTAYTRLPYPLNKMIVSDEQGRLWVWNREAAILIPVPRTTIKQEASE